MPRPLTNTVVVSVSRTPASCDYRAAVALREARAVPVRRLDRVTHRYPELNTDDGERYFGVRWWVHGAQAGRRSCLSTQVVNAPAGRGLPV
jgi:hypothetical protein